MNKNIFEYQIKQIEKIERGCLIKELCKPVETNLTNIGKPWTDEEKKKVTLRFKDLITKGLTKKDAIKTLSKTRSWEWGCPQSYLS